MAAIRDGYCRDPTMAHLLRGLFYLEAKHEMRLTMSQGSRMRQQMLFLGTTLKNSSLSFHRLSHSHNSTPKDWWRGW